MESEQFLHNRARTQKRKQRATASQESRAKEGQFDKSEKRRYIHGESSDHNPGGHRYKVKYQANQGPGPTVR